MVLWSNFTFTLWTLNYDPHRKGPYCPSVICDSVVFIIHSGADCEIFSMIWLTWKHRLWICLSHVGRASRAAIIIAHPFTTKVHDQPFTLRGFCITTKVWESHPHRSCSASHIVFITISLTKHVRELNLHGACPWSKWIQYVYKYYISSNIWYEYCAVTICMALFINPSPYFIL